METRFVDSSEKDGIWFMSPARNFVKVLNLVIKLSLNQCGRLGLYFFSWISLVSVRGGHTRKSLVSVRLHVEKF